jgi:4-hydroxybenzoate polyprenyltransferase
MAQSSITTNFNKRTLQFWARLIRWGEWYNSKLPLVALAVMYVTWHESPDPTLALVALGLGLAFAILYLAFGYLINDLSDWEVDIQAGKQRVAHQLGRPFARLVAVVLFVLSLACLAPYWVQPTVILQAVACYGLALAYSFPPLRLKERGWWGLMSGSLAQRALPALLAATLVAPLIWELGIFALLYLLIGLRWILIHQIEDREHDIATGIHTYVTDHGETSNLRRLQEYVFALEVVCLVILWGLVTKAAPVFAAVGVGYIAYLAYIYRSYRRIGITVSLYSYAYVPLADLYLIIWPLAMAILLAAQNPIFLILVALELVWKWNYARHHAFNFAVHDLYRRVRGLIFRIKSIKTKEDTNEQSDQQCCGQDISG